MSVLEKIAVLHNELGPKWNSPAPPLEGEAPLNIICMADVEAEPVRWLWEPYIPLGKITILQGDPGLGKTFFATRIAAIVSAGGTFPIGGNIFADEPANVLFQTAEDGLADTIKARLVDAGADCSRVFVIDESQESLTLDDLRLRSAMLRLHPKLIIIDPIQAYLGANTDMHRANEIRPIMSRLGTLAAEFQCAVVLIGHQNKANGGKGIYRGLGSIDIAAAARSVLAVGEVPDMKCRRAVVQIKSSLAPTGQTMLFDLDPGLGFLWAGVSDLTADDVLNYKTPIKEREAPERDEAEDFLKELLSDEDMPGNQVKNAASEAGFSWITIRRAKEKLGIECYKGKGYDKAWYWHLAHPKTHEQHEQDEQITYKDAHVVQLAHVKKGEQVTETVQNELPFV